MFQALGKKFHFVSGSPYVHTESPRRTLLLEILVTSSHCHVLNYAVGSLEMSYHSCCFDTQHSSLNSSLKIKITGIPQLLLRFTLFEPVLSIMLHHASSSPYAEFTRRRLKVIRSQRDVPKS